MECLGATGDPQNDRDWSEERGQWEGRARLGYRKTPTVVLPEDLFTFGLVVPQKGEARKISLILFLGVEAGAHDHGDQAPE